MKQLLKQLLSPVSTGATIFLLVILAALVWKIVESDVVLKLWDSFTVSLSAPKV